MKLKLTFNSLLLVALLLALTRTSPASATWYVDGVHGSDSNNCLSPTTACKTIGHAISLAASGDSIMVAAATYYEHLTIGISLNVLGAGASTTTIDAGNVATVVTIWMTNAHVTLSGLTIRNGGNASSGGIYNVGTLMLIDSTVSGNTLYCIACGGAGIYNGGTATIRNSTISGNRLVCVKSGFYCIAHGGGIHNNDLSTLTISNSTIAGNSVGFFKCTPPSCRVGISGGGISNRGTATISNSTVSGNSARSGGGGIFNWVGMTTIQNSILANNPSGNCSGTMTSHGYNMSSDNTCNFHNSGDRNNTNPMLGPLQYNGGPTQTMALPSGSPAIDTGNPSGCTDGSGHLLTKDQRGMPRPDSEDKTGCDMGAHESQSD